MRFTSWPIIVFLSILSLYGCSSTQHVMRPAPKGGVPVSGVNVLYVIVPLTTARSLNGATEKLGARDLAKPREQAEKLGNDINERLIPQLREKGIAANFATLQVISGVAPTPVSQLFSTDTGDRHLLTITPIAESRSCSATCLTEFTVSLSARTPKDNREVWNSSLRQANLLSDIVPGRNNAFIDDIAKAILEVITPISTTKQ